MGLINIPDRPRIFKPIGMPQIDWDDPLNRGLVGHWGMFPYEFGGKVIHDLSGNGNTGIFGAGAASPSWVAGKLGTCLDFDGGDYIELPTSILGSDLGSVSLWLKTITDFSVAGMIFYGSDTDNADGFGTDSELHLHFTTDEEIGLFIRGEPSVNIKTSSSYSDGNWHHVVATWDRNGNAVLYIDGNLENSTTDDSRNFSFTSVFRIGRPGYDSRYFSGLIDNVITYNRVLSAGEIAELYRRPF